MPVGSHQGVLGAFDILMFFIMIPAVHMRCTTTKGIVVLIIWWFGVNISVLEALEYSPQPLPCLPIIKVSSLLPQQFEEG